MDKKDVNKLVKLYFEYNPHNNKGLAYRAKANDIISAYANVHGFSYNNIEECIKANPMHDGPIWDVFYHYFFKKNINKKKVEKKSNYKDSVSDSTDINDWM